MNEDIKIAILSLLSVSGTSWNWYKLDRALSARGLGGQCNVAEIALSLSREGLLKESVEGNSAMPMYTISEEGRRWLESRL